MTVPETEPDPVARDWRDLIGLDEVPVGELVAVNIGRHSILVVRDGDEVSALQNVCPHEHCYLDQGTLEDGAVVCAGHNWRFDAKTGEGIRPRRAKLGRYATRITDGRIQVSLR